MDNNSEDKFLVAQRLKTLYFCILINTYHKAILNEILKLIQRMVGQNTGLTNSH
jgi:hypothetical protein